MATPTVSGASLSYPRKYHPVYYFFFQTHIFVLISFKKIQQFLYFDRTDCTFTDFCFVTLRWCSNISASSGVVPSKIFRTISTVDIYTHENYGNKHPQMHCLNLFFIISTRLLCLRFIKSNFLSLRNSEITILRDTNRARDRHRHR